jgi:lysophospholipase
MATWGRPCGSPRPLLDGLTEVRAPFHRRLAGGAAEARWLVLPDGVRLRAVHWRRGAPRGTVLIFTGRTEYAEKYGRVAGSLAARGYAVLTVDWRGQGLSDRLRGGDRSLGHVGRWSDYQRDVGALVAHGRELGLTDPRFLLAHSMGGAIGLRALIEGLPVKAAAFSAPMWGFQVGVALKPAAWPPVPLGRGLTGLLAAPQEAEALPLGQGFAENLLTSDRETWDWLRSQVSEVPDLRIGMPTLTWLNEAVREMWRLMAGPVPELPVLGLMGTEELVVDPGRIRRRLGDWPGARLVTLEGARHEVLMERPEIRDRALEEVLAHFEGARES